jgi:hypothetical protein
MRSDAQAQPRSRQVPLSTPGHEQRGVILDILHGAGGSMSPGSDDSEKRAHIRELSTFERFFDLDSW